MAAERLRVAVVLPTFPELSNTFVLNQIVGLLDRGHDVDLFALRVTPEQHHREVVDRYRLRERQRHLVTPIDRLQRIASVLSRLASGRGLHPAALDALNPIAHGRDALRLVSFHTAVSFLGAGRYDVVHCQFGELAPTIARLRRLGAVDAAIVTSFRGADLTMLVPAAPRRYAALFADGDLFLPVSDEFARRLVALGVDADRVRVLRSGIDLGKIAFEPRRRPAERVTLLCVGRLTEKKGFAYAIDALARLVADRVDAELVVVGDGGLRASLETQAADRGVAERVRFPGALDHDAVVAAMRGAHVLLAPSVKAANGDEEGIPNVVKEAMASGLPVVSTRHSGIPELVEDGVTGHLAPERDGAALAERVRTLLDAADAWGPMLEAARRTIERSYAIEPLNDALVDHYRVAIERRRRAVAVVGPRVART